MKIKRTSKTVFVWLMLSILAMSIFAKVDVLPASASSASSMIVLETTTNRILYQQNAYDKRFMASTTKILTAITTIENTDIQSVVTITKPMVGIEGSSIYLQVGEQIRVIDLLYGLMLRSGNDAATALAIYTSNSVEEFAKLMNETAKKAGAQSSNFVNPHGLHSDNHYTTAYDLGLITSYALKNPIFATISATKSYTFDRCINNTAKDNTKAPSSKAYTFNNKNKILHTTEGGDGVKTGFTKKAGRCLVSSATRDNMQIVCVVLNCGPMFEESKALLNKAFDNYKLTEILPSYTYAGTIHVKNSRTPELRTYTKIPIVYPIRDSEQNAIIKITDCKELSAPIKANQEIGTIKVYLHNTLIAEPKLYSMDSAKSLNLLDNLKELLDDWF